MQSAASMKPSDDRQGWALPAIDAAPVPMVVVDSGGRILLANAASEAAFGCARWTLAGARFETLLDPESTPAWTRAAQSLLEGRRGPRPPEELELTGVRHGLPFPLEASVARVDGVGLVVVLRDVGAAREASAREAAGRRELLVANERLDALLEFTPAFILSVSRDGEIEFINRTLPQYTRKSTIGTSWLQYFEPSRHAAMTQHLADVFETGASPSYEISTPGPDGALVWFDTRIGPMRVEGEVVAAVLVSQEVTDRKRAQAEVLAGRPMALLGTLASGIAHEINTPVQFVGDSIHFLREGADALFLLLEKLKALRTAARNGGSIDAIFEAVAQAEEEADLPYLRANMPDAFESCIQGLARVSTIVRSLKEFAHPSDEAMAPADLNRAIQSSVSIAINEYKYVAELTMDLGELPPVTCRLGEIAQAVLNIVVNAAHAIEGVVAGTDDKGLITICSWRDDDSVVVSIRDTGGGIPESIQSRIFDPFFTTKEVGKGTGQGLAIARTAVNEHHSGQLTFETAPGQGTTFFLRLPILPPHAAAGSQA